MHRNLAWPGTALATLILLSGCATSVQPPRLGAASPAPLQRCSELGASFNFASTRLTATTLEPAGSLANAGQPVETYTIDDVMDLLDAIESGGGRIAKA